jgi:hypothetical protein
MQLRGSFRVPFGSSSGERIYDRVCSGACRPSLNLVSKSLDSDHCREVEMACLAAKEVRFGALGAGQHGRAELQGGRRVCPG